MTWNPYTRNRKIKNLQDYSIIIPENFSNDGMPLFCEVCKICYSSKEDELTFKKFGCCTICADTWAYSHKIEWEKGWRPSEDQIEISVSKRQLVNEFIQFE